MTTDAFRSAAAARIVAWESELRFLQEHKFRLEEELGRLANRINCTVEAIEEEKAGAKQIPNEAGETKSMNANNETKTGRKVKWLAGWYASVLHAYDGPGTMNPGHQLDAVCGNGVYREPRTESAARKIAKGNVPHCKKCERILASMPAVQV